MKRLWAFIGHTAYWLSWPALFVWLYFTKRTRVLVVSGEEVLVVKGWLSSGRWSLPGGGLHVGETPEAGAARELKEETGIRAAKPQLKFLLETKAQDDNGLKYHYIAFSYHTAKKPALSRQKLELTSLEWIKWRDLYNDPKTSADIRAIIDSWRSKR